MKIYIVNNKIYYKKNKNDNLNEINNDNWSIYLQGWNKFPESWQNIINISNLGLKESLQDGNCLFSSISYGLNLNNQFNKINYKYNSQLLRNFLSNEITKSNFNEIIELYKIEKKNNEFNGSWNPLNINTIQKFKNIIKNSDNKYWGDYISISLLEKILKINFLILNSENNNIYYLGNDINKYSKTMILYYEDSIHFMLVGYFKNNKMITLFENNNLPAQIYKLYKNI